MTTPVGSVSLSVTLAALWTLSLTPPTLAIDGPTVQTIPNADWGGPNDPWPHVVRLEIDQDGNGLFDESAHCTGTLIAPNVVATAGHCFRDLVGANSNIPVNRVRVNFGPGASTQYILNSGGRTHNVLGHTSATDPDTNDFALIILEDTAPVSPIPILPRPARVNDTNYAVGFGSDEHNNFFNADRIEVMVDGYFQHQNGAKNWATITVDAVTASGSDANLNPTGGFIEQDQKKPENWTETGDSGGPGILRIGTMPDRAWGPTIGNFAKGDFVMSAVSGGLTPATDDSSDPDIITYPANGSTTDDFWTRLDAERNFIYQHGPSSIKPGTVSIFHNLPDDVSSIQPNDKIAVFVRASFPFSTSDYLLHINVWEEDNQPFGDEPFNFNGDVDLRNTEFMDDLAGFGFSAGSLTGLQTDVVAWDIRDASALIPFDESGNALDPPLDWVFQINYGDALQFTNASAEVTPTTFEQVMAQINTARTEINQNLTTVRGGFALVPEPAPIVLMSLGTLALCRRQHRTATPA
ncbi:MAG: hypothetical protein Kow00105_04840 [Phycisphaeraceae bacterium]